MLGFLGAFLEVFAAERVLLYARLTDNLIVELTDGSKWSMDKGDCFPVVAYKEAHTKLILQLAGATTAPARCVSDAPRRARVAVARTSISPAARCAGAR